MRQRLMTSNAIFRLAALFLAFCVGVSHGWVIPTSSTLSLRLDRSKLYSNVVLRPSNDPQAFDSSMIGSARVHRYARDNSDTEAEYVMWYHGRSKDFDENKELPKLSTGRIGRATSLNGLAWKKSVEGSASEDAPDVSLGLNKESWWSFDTAHVGLGQVLLPMSTPAVISEGGVYLMYYMGGNFEEKPIADYLETNDVETDATIKGMHMKIGVAVSQDGKTWGRIEGDHHTGAIMAPYDLSDPNAPSVADSPTMIDEELYCAWPEVVVHTEEDVQVEKGLIDKGFFMYYSTMRKKDKQKCLAYAVSEDGFRWSKRGICVEPDATGLDAGGCARCNVVQNAEYNEETRTWKGAKGWTMYYEGISPEDGKHRVMMAESEDGIKWEKKGIALDVGSSADAWDVNGVGSPHTLRLDDGTLRMYYTGQGADGSTAIGVAKFDSSSAKWSREQAEFSFAT